MAKLKFRSKRDYRAEYRRRVQRGLGKGLSLSQARGHPKVSEKPIRQPRPIADDRLQISLKALRSGKPLIEAAKQIRVSPERLRNQAKALGGIHKKHNRWVVKQTLPRQMLIYSEGEARTITIGRFKYASKLGSYMAAVGRFLSSNDISYLEPFIGKSVKDNRGNIYVFETNPNALYRIAASGQESFEQIYRIVI